MIYKGFRFGMLLQIAIGPVSIFILQTAITTNFLTAEAGVWGAVLIDAVYILLAILGLGAILEKSGRAKIILKYCGAFILILFGLANVLGMFGISFLPSLNLSVEQETSNVFLKVVLLTLSSPLTIIFWAGVFSTRILEDQMTGREVYLFGGGALLSTILFQTLIAFSGSLIQVWVSDSLINILNAIVGLVLIYFGFHTALLKL